MCRFALVHCAIISFAAQVAADELLSSRTSLLEKLASDTICSLVWPRTGQDYPVGTGIYVSYYCEMGLNDVERAQYFNRGTNNQTPNITVVHKLSMWSQQDLNFGPVLSQIVPYVHRVISPFLSEDLVIDLPTHNFPGSHVVKYMLLVYIDGVVIDSPEVVFNTVTQEFVQETFGAQWVGDTSIKCAYSPESMSCLPGSTVLPGRHFDFVEVGTSGYDTLIQLADNSLVGLSIEPLKDVQDTLPNWANVIKVNCAISNAPSWKDIYFIPKVTFEAAMITMAEDDPNKALYGLSMIGQFNNYYNHALRAAPTFNILEILAMTQRKLVPLRPAGQLLAEHGVESITFLKVDTEGFDNLIVNNVLDFFEFHKLHLPAVIQFENIFAPIEALKLSHRLGQLGYHVYMYHFNARVARHDEATMGTFGDVYAELSNIDPNVHNMSAVQRLLPTALISGRDACHSFHAIQSRMHEASSRKPGSRHNGSPDHADTETSVRKPLFCSILSRGRYDHPMDLISISDTLVLGG
jgi:hypothetical protein